MGQLFLEQLSSGPVIRGAIIQWDNCPGAIIRGGNCPRTIEANLFQFLLSWPMKFILREINFRLFLQKHFSRVKL